MNFSLGNKLDRLQQRFPDIPRAVLEGAAPLWDPGMADEATRVELLEPLWNLRRLYDKSLPTADPDALANETRQQQRAFRAALAAGGETATRARRVAAAQQFLAVYAFPSGDWVCGL